MEQPKPIAGITRLPGPRKPAAASPSPAVRGRLKLVELLLEVSRRMAAYDTLDDVLRTLVEMTTVELGAERGTLFLNDPETNELYSRVAQGNIKHEIRLLNTSGIAGHVFTSGESVLIQDAYSDPRFNRSVDEQTGFVTRNILCTPIRTVKGEIIGDGVNLASRLESACKQYGTHILVSAFTYAKLRGTYRARELDLVVVKGKTQPIAIYEILDYHNEETYPRLVDALGYFRDGLAMYRQGRWSDAQAQFAEVTALNSADKAAQLYVERCHYLSEHPPGDDWNGVWVMQKK